MKYCDLNGGGEGDRGALYRGCQMNHVASIKLLLKTPKIVLNRPSRSGLTPLSAACYGNLTDVVKLVLAHPRFEFPVVGPGYWPGIQIAAQNGHPNVVHLLVTVGATKKVAFFYSLFSVFERFLFCAAYPP